MTTVIGRGVAVAAVVVVIGALARSAGAEPIAVVIRSERGEAAAEFLATQIKDQIVVRHSRYLDDPAKLLEEARAGWGERLVVVLDARRAIVRVIRTTDGTITARSLDPVAAEAPYAISLAAVELLGIVKTAPEARTTLPVEPPVPPPDSGKRRARIGPVISFGVQQTLATSGDVLLLQPTLAVEARLLRETGTWFSLGAHAAGLTSQTRSQLLVLPDGPDEDASVEYGRNELALRLGIGHRQGIGSITGWTNLGVAVVDVEARDGQGRHVAGDDRAAFWLGIGGELRYGFGKGVSMGLGAGGAFYPVTSQFFATPRGAAVPVSAFEESRFELRGRLVLVWEKIP